ncbi:MAG: type II toxin-antitoxin system Phd/YefM family antitoxin [Rhodothermales bacterium]|nr:type II toxin-antitoxin system Phd/YefM family antitoxin [Rhodothermales bacterium]
MKTYTYTEARQRLAQLLDEASNGGEVRIRRRDGTEFSVRPLAPKSSPLDVPGVETGWTADEIVAEIRAWRERPTLQA